ncbi:MAG TPA: aminodeoxychorismate/anthranilate synthase component II, partial [Planctomycetota bacterium]|nr:aminodeoxychorismate/anthranilate synthase component II [Planctomycetota bacterium]
NDKITPKKASALRPTHLIISPGPCTPLEAGVSNDMIRHFAGRIPVLGVCLGHQCIAHAFGGRVTRADRLMHGKVSEIHHDGRTVYAGLPNPFIATRYHSLIVRDTDVPKDFDRTAWTEPENELMGLRHRTLAVEGVQFHPESFLTEVGYEILRNFMKTSGPEW